MASAPSSPLKSSPRLNHIRYDVFLSFRSDDTCRILTLRDNDEIDKVKNPRSRSVRGQPTATIWIGFKFEGMDFRRWQKKMHFFLTSVSVVYVLSTPCPEDGDDATVEQIRRRSKWENDDYIARGLILNGMADSFFDIYQNYESAKVLWDSLETKYMSEDAFSKKFLVSNFNNYKMVDSRPVMEQYNELLRILGHFTQHKMNMDEAISVSSVIDKLPPSWKEYKHSLKHKKEELTLVELGSHLRIEESLRMHENDKPKSNEVADTSAVNMVEHKKSTGYNDRKGKRKHQGNNNANPNKKTKLTCCRRGKTEHLKHDCKVNIGNKNTNEAGTSGSGNGFNNHNSKGQNMFNNSLQNYYVSYISEAYFVQDDDVAWWVDSGATTHVCKDRYCFFIWEMSQQPRTWKCGFEVQFRKNCFFI